MKKPMAIIANKMDLTGSEKAVAALKKKYPKHKIFPISAATGEGLNALLAYAVRALSKAEAETPPAPEEPLRFVIELDYQVERQKDQFIVKGSKVERLAAMTHFDQREGLKRFQNILKKMGVEKELARQGAQPGDPVRIGKNGVYL